MRWFGADGFVILETSPIFFYFITQQIRARYPNLETQALQGDIEAPLQALWLFLLQVEFYRFQ